MMIVMVVLMASIGCDFAYSQQLYRFYNPGDWVSYTNTRYVTSIAEGFNTIYFGTTGGILRYDMHFDKWLDPITTSNGLPDHRIRKIAVERMTDEIWVETYTGSFYYNPAFDEWRDYSPFPAEKMQPDGLTIRDLPQFIVPFGYNYHPEGYLVDRYLMEYPITQMMRDENDVAWLGLWGLGPAKADLRLADLKPLPFGPYDADLARIDLDGTDFWMLGGGDGIPGAINHYNRADESWEYFEPRRNSGIISDQFYSIVHDDKAVWIGTELGLVRYDKRNGNFRSYSHFDGIYGERVSALLSVKDNLIIGTEIGVSVYDLKRDSIYSATGDDIKGKPVYDLALKDRVIYAATEYGIYSLVWGGNAWRRLELGSPELKSPVYDIQIVDTLLYTAGYDGVAIVNLNHNSFKLYDRNARFRNADLRTLLIHQGVIWVGGTDGLYRLNNRTGNWYRYTINDGLIGIRVTSLVGDGDYIWIATDRGLTRFMWKNFSRKDWLE